MADTGKIKEMKDREERCERAQKYVNELQEVHQRVQFEAKGTQKKLNALRKRAAAAAEVARRAGPWAALTEAAEATAETAA